MNRLLSHHEIAALLLLASAPVSAAFHAPDVYALAREELVELVEVVEMPATYSLARLTPSGWALVKRFNSV